MKFVGRHFLKIAVALTLAGSAGMLTAGDASAALNAYSAKFVCGSRSTELGVVRGVYETTINVHNPHFVDVQFQKKAVIALPERTVPRGPISQLRPEQLTPDQSFGVDCKDIRGLFAPPATGFIEGFVVIYIDVNLPLDVVGVYTARERTGTNADTAIYDASSIDIQPVTPISVVFPGASH